MFVVVSLIGKPRLSKPHVRPRSCSIFCCASTAANVVVLALAFVRVESVNSCASDATPTTRIDVAINTSSSEKPRSPPAPRGSRLAVHLYFANAIHHDVLRSALASQRDRHAGRPDTRPRIAGTRVGVHRTVGPELHC